MPKYAVITLDFINDIANLNGKIASSAQRIIDHGCIENANLLTAWARENEFPVIHVKVGFSSSYIECPATSPIFSAAKKYRALELNTWGTEFVQNLIVKDSDHILVKHRVSAFYATDLEAVLSAQNCNTLILAGTATNMAVEATSRDAHDRDYSVIIATDACETLDDATQQASFNNLKRLGQLIDTKTFLSTFN